jgi:hypothetical protein
LLILILVLGLYLWLAYFGLAETIVTKILNDQVGHNLGIRFHIDKITGDYFSSPVIKGVDVIYENGTDTYTMAHVSRLTAQYSLEKLWRGEFIFNKIEIDSTQITIKKTAERWMLPKPLKRSERSSTSLDFEIQELILKDLTFTLQQPNDTLVFEDIILDARIEARDKTYSAIIDRLSYRSSDRRFSLVSAGGTVTSTGNQVMFQDFKIVTDSSNCSAGGQIVFTDKPHVQLAIQAKRINLGELSSFINIGLNGNVAADGSINFYDGKLSGKLAISGTLEDRYFDSLNSVFRYGDQLLIFDTLDGYAFHGCHIQAKGDLDLSREPVLYHLIGSVEHFNLNNIAFDTYTSNLNGRLNLTGTGLESDDLSLDIVAEMDESWFDDYHISMAMGEMTITTDSIVLHDKFALKYKDNSFVLSGKLDYHGPIILNGSTKFDDLSAFNDQTFIKKMGGRAELNFQVSGELSNPDVSGRFNSDSLWLYEIMSRRAVIDFSIDHFLNDREGKIYLSLFDGTAYDIKYDSILLKMRVDSQYANINSALLANEDAVVTAKADLDYGSYPQRLTMDSVGIDFLGLSFENDNPIVVEMDSSGYDVLSCRLQRPTGYLEASGRINNNDSMNVQLFGYRVNITPWIKLYYNDYDIGGYLSGEVDISGDFQAPNIKFNGGIDSITYTGFFLGDLTADFDYTDKLVTINNIALESKEGNYIAAGTFPVDLTFAAVPDRFSQNRDQDIRITAYDKRLDLTSLLVQEVEDFKGDFNADINLTGTVRNPEIDGLASIKNGRLKIYDLVLPLENLNVDMKMKNKTISFTKMSAECKNGKNKPGLVNGSGTVVVNSIDQFDYNLNIDVKQFPAQYELGDISAVVDADLKIRGSAPPTVSGDVNIISANYGENFAGKDEGWILLSSFQEKNSWNINLNVEAVSNLWIKNDDIDAELGGQINFVRENDRYRYFGTMEILRGKAYLADRSFKLESGGTVSYQDVEVPNPQLDIWASTNIRTATHTGFNNEIEYTNEDLRIHVGGTLDEPIITTDENSPLGTSSILSALLLNYNPSDTAGKVEPTDRAISGVSNFISQQVGRIGSRYIGVETLEIDPVYGDKFDPLGTRLTVGKYWGPNLYIYGRSAISFETGQEVGFEYRLKRFLLIEGNRDQDNLYHLNLNFNWNY